VASPVHVRSRLCEKRYFAHKKKIYLSHTCRCVHRKFSSRFLLSRSEISNAYLTWNASSFDTRRSAENVRHATRSKETDSPTDFRRSSATHVCSRSILTAMEEILRAIAFIARVTHALPRERGASGCATRGRLTRYAPDRRLGSCTAALRMTED